jgi:hypothetical protein
MMAYITSEIDHDWVPGDPEIDKWHVVTHHRSAFSFWHNRKEVGFFTEHRNYLQEMEQYLLNTPGCDNPLFVPLPSFNPAASAGGIPLEFFQAPNSAHPSVPTGFPMLTDRTPDFSMIPVNEQTCTQFANIDAFANTVEGQHNTVHNRIGGTMSNPGISPGATIFWLWHAYVDDMYNCFQQKCQGCKPAFVRVKKATGVVSRSTCDYCLDLSKSTDVTNYTFQLIDNVTGINKTITLNRSGCISYKDMVSGHPYTLIITGTNNSSGNNLCGLDEIEYEFTAPIQPPKTKFGDPCSWAIVKTEPNPPIIGGHMRIGITSNAFSGKMNVSLVNVMSGATNILASNRAFTANIEEEIILNTSGLNPGTYKVVAESEGDIVETSVVIMN